MNNILVEINDLVQQLIEYISLFHRLTDTQDHSVMTKCSPSVLTKQLLNNILTYKQQQIIIYRTIHTKCRFFDLPVLEHHKFERSIF